MHERACLHLLILEEFDSDRAELRVRVHEPNIFTRPEERDHISRNVYALISPRA